MSVEIKSSGDTVTAYLSGELDHHSAKEMRQAVDDAVELNMPSKLVLDFKGVSFMDSSGIGLVMGRYRLLMNFHSTLEIRNVTKQTKKLMELAGLGSIAIIKEV